MEYENDAVVSESCVDPRPIRRVGSGRIGVRLVGVEDPEGVPRVSGEEEREEDRGDQERSR